MKTFSRSLYALVACPLLVGTSVSAQALPNDYTAYDTGLVPYQQGILLEPSPFVRRLLFNTEIQRHYGNALAAVTIGLLQENATPNAYRLNDSPAIHLPQTAFVALSAAYAFDQRLSIGAQASYGKSVNLSGLTMHKDTLNTVAYAIELRANTIWQRGDQIGLSLSIPTKVTSGDIKLTNSLTPGSELPFGYETKILNMRPSATERNWELSYTNTVGKDATLVFGLRLRLNPGHDASAPSSRGIGVRFSQRF